jgi:hypothetical protein
MKTIVAIPAVLALGGFLFLTWTKSSVSDASAVKYSFKTKIEYSNPQCGFAKGGRIATLVNTDSGQSYKVTVQVTKVKSGHPDYPVKGTSVHRIAAGDSKKLGCTSGSYNPYPDIRYEILGEEVA